MMHNAHERLTAQHLYETALDGPGEESYLLLHKMYAKYGAESPQLIAACDYSNRISMGIHCLLQHVFHDTDITQMRSIATAISDNLAAMRRIREIQ